MKTKLQSKLSQNHRVNESKFSEVIKKYNARNNSFKALLDNFRKFINYPKIKLYSTCSIEYRFVCQPY